MSKDTFTGSQRLSCSSLFDGVDQLFKSAQEVEKEEEDLLKLVKEKSTEFWLFGGSCFAHIGIMGCLQTIYEELEAAVEEPPNPTEPTDSGESHLQHVSSEMPPAI